MDSRFPELSLGQMRMRVDESWRLRDLGQLYLMLSRNNHVFYRAHINIFFTELSHPHLSQALKFIR